MTIVLSKAARVGGVLLASGSTQILDPSVEADLVTRGNATYSSDPMIGGEVPVMASKTLTGKSVILDPITGLPMELGGGPTLALNIAGSGEAPTGLNSSGGRDRVFSRSVFPVRLAASEISFMLSNQLMGINSESAGPAGQIVMGAALEVNGVSYPCTFGGSPSATMTAGQAALVADYVSVQVEAGDTAFVRVQFDTTTSGGIAGNGRSVTGSVTYSYSSANENNQLGTLGTPTQPSGASGMFQASATMLLGKVSVGSVAVLGCGDSIMDGFHDNPAFDGSNGGGIGRNAANIAKIPYASYAAAGKTLASMTGATPLLNAMATYHTHAWQQLGTNDITGINFSTLSTNYATTWAKLKANLVGHKYVGQTTIFPRVLSTDGCTTLANQAPLVGYGVSSTRDLLHFMFNINYQNGVIDGVLDISAAVQSPTNQNLWALRGFTTTLASAFVSGAVISVASLPEFGEELVASAATSPTTSISLAKSFTGTASPFALTLSNALNAAQGAGAVISATYATDGTHPARLGTRAAALKLLADFQVKR